MKTTVLFLCTGNSCRSQMAEAFLRERGSERFQALSAGTDPRPIHELTFRVMDEVGIDIRGQESKDLAEYLGRCKVDHVIIVCDQASRTCPAVWPGVHQRHFWPFDDPAELEGSEEEIMAGFRRVRDEIDRRIQRWLEEELA